MLKYFIKKAKTTPPKKFRKTISYLEYVVVFIAIYAGIAANRYAFQIGDYLVSSHLLTGLLLCISLLLAGFLYRLKNINYKAFEHELTDEIIKSLDDSLIKRLDSKTPNPKFKKLSKFVNTGIILLAVSVVVYLLITALYLKRNVVYVSKEEQALSAYTDLKSKDCTLSGYEVRYKADLKPIIVKDNGNDFAAYLTDEISFSNNLVNGKPNNVKYYCKNGETITSEFRFKRLLTK